jgi:hypothetical protein
MALTEEQRKNREGLYSSDIARLMNGQSVKVALEKLGHDESGEVVEPPNLDEVDEIQLGELTEPYILEAYKRKYNVELETSPEFIHPDIPWMGSHPDSTVLPNKKVIVEAKTVGVYNIHEWGNPGTDQVNFYTLWQSVVHMACANADRVDVVACFMTLEATKYILLKKPPPIHVFHIYRDFEAEDLMVRKSKYVHDHIVAGVSPPPETLDDAKLIWSKASGVKVEATEDIVIAYNNLIKLRSEYEALGKLKDSVELQIKSFMGNASALTFENQTLATWRNDRDSVALDKKLLAEKQPDIYKEFLVPTRGSRRFLVKSLKS